MQLKHKGTLYD